LIPAAQVSFWVNLVIGVIAFGGIGVWFELLKHFTSTLPEGNFSNLTTALNTYFPASVWAASMQMVMAEEDKKYLRSFAYGISSILLVLSIVLLFGEDVITARWSLGLGLMASIVAIVMWWVANGREEMFHDVVEPDAPIGGSVSSLLKGDTTGYTT